MTEPTTYTCDRCGREMDIWWEIEGVEGVGGNCTACNDNLCKECAGEWSEYGECEKCADAADLKETEVEK